MRFSTPISIQRVFYLGVDTNAYPGDEKFGLGIFNLYLGYYGQPDILGGWCFGILDKNGCL
jgi:hypothetical protein